jgi:ATP-dependent helicase/nuclease subunit A
LELALAYERNETPSLQGFLAWLRASPTPVKRDMEIARDEVRVMTVHGAKGLEAPVVILADTTTPPRGTHQPRLLELPIDSAPGASPVIVWAGRKIDDVPAVAAARQSALDEVENEHRRLLYVAMTRAAERLIVCGYEGKSARKPGCWYDLVLDGLKDKPGFAEIGDGDTRLWRYCKAPDLDRQPAPRPQQRSPPPEEPSWLTAQAPAELDRPVALTPSTAHEETAQHTGAPRGTDRGEDVARAMERGTLLHRLMQSLPDVAPSRREEAAHNYLALAAASFSAEERDHFAAQALAVLADARFAPLFAGESRAEVPIVGRLPRPGRPDFMVAGQIDRLVVTAEAVLIADYKTNRHPPQTVEAAPQAYVEQLALYCALLRRIYPERPVRAALVWTDIPHLMEIPAVTLDAALARLTAA